MSRCTPGSPGEVYEAVRDKIVALYTAIILYQLAIYRFLKQGKITHGIQSLVPYELQDLSSSIQKKSEEVERSLNLSNRELLHNIFENVQLQEPITQIGDQLRQVLDVVMDIEENKYSEVLNWVSPILHMDHHRPIQPMEGTGKRLLDHPHWKEWRESKSSGLLWLRGKMSARKSNLVYCSLLLLCFTSCAKIANE